MLTPEQLAHCADDIVELYSKLNEEIVRDIARRIAKTGDVTPSGKLQILALQNSGMLAEDILRSVSGYSGISEQTLYDLFENTGITAVEYDMEIYTANGLNPLPLNMSPAAMQILEAGFNKTNGNLRNLTQTTATTAQADFISECTLAEMKVESGAFSPQQAIVDAVRKLASKGAFVQYPSGHRDKLDVAVRRNVMTGIGQTTGEICLGYAKELGCDLMEITAHAGARPSHAAWQGQIVSLSGQSGYLSFSDIGYGTGEGFKGWNCRHDWYPYFEGSARAYSDEALARLDEQNIEYPDGSMHTLYEAEQQQRAFERKIRETKRILAAQDEFIKNTADSPLGKAMQNDFDKQSITLKRQEAQMKAFCEKTGLRVKSERVQKYGFGKSVSQKAIYKDKALFQEYRYYMGEHAQAHSIEEFRDIYLGNSREYNLFKKVKEVNSLYKTDFGKIEPYKIFELDQKALREKRYNFTGTYKKSGNFAIMEYNNQFYFAHSLANLDQGVETKAFARYKGNKSHLARNSHAETERYFKTFNVTQDTGKKLPEGYSGNTRFQTFFDTEAKLFESLERIWYTSDVTDIYMLSERGMCDSCKFVAEQFMKKHPEASINIVSGKKAAKISWKGRKPYVGL